MIQGIAISFIFAAIYAIVGIIYPDDPKKYLGIIQACVGLSVAIGPVLGSLSFMLGGFSLTFGI